MPRLLLLATDLLVVVGGAAQTPPRGTRRPPARCRPRSSDPESPRRACPRPPVASTRTSPRALIVPAPPAEKSVEQLLKDLEAVQAQKADILRRRT
jgi:hypothetical protein